MSMQSLTEGSVRKRGLPDGDHGDPVARLTGGEKERALVACVLRFDPQLPSLLKAFEPVIRIR